MLCLTHLGCGLYVYFPSHSHIYDRHQSVQVQQAHENSDLDHSYLHDGSPDCIDPHGDEANINRYLLSLPAHLQLAILAARRYPHHLQFPCVPDALNLLQAPAGDIGPVDMES